MMEGKESGYVARNPNNIVYDINHNDDDDGNDADVDSWGVLIAVSDKAKSRPQGPQILLHNSEHVLGRLVKDPSCRFDSLNVSAKHCTIFRKKIKAESLIPVHGTEIGDCWLVYIKDSSSNGTFINCQKLVHDNPEARIKDGDIISLVNTLEHENAYSFLYQEIKPSVQPNGSSLGALKRKPPYNSELMGESCSNINKRVQGVETGGLHGSVCLDDVQQLQQRNKELQTQVEEHLLSIDQLCAESHSVTAAHDAEMKELRETISTMFLEQINNLHTELWKKKKDLDSISSLHTQTQTQLEERNRCLAAMLLLWQDADDVISSQKLKIDDLKQRLEDECAQHKSEKERAEIDFVAEIRRVHYQASEELKCKSESHAEELEGYSIRISKLEETERENCSLIETQHLKLEEIKVSLINADQRRTSLEIRLQEEECSLSVARKEMTEKELQLQSIVMEMLKEKVAKEAALVQLSATQVKMQEVLHELSVQHKEAQEFMTLRQIQLHAVQMTAEEIATLQRKQEQQLKEMMRVLDGERHLSATSQSYPELLKKIMKTFDTLRSGAMQAHEQNLEANNEGRVDDASNGEENDTVVVYNALEEKTNDTGNAEEEIGGDAGICVRAFDQHELKVSSNGCSKEDLLLDKHDKYLNETQDLETERAKNDTMEACNGDTQLLGIQNNTEGDQYIVESIQLLHNESSVAIMANVGDTLLLEGENDVEMNEWGGIEKRHVVLSGNSDQADSAEEASVGNKDGASLVLRNAPLAAIQGIKEIVRVTTHELTAIEMAGSWAQNTPSSLDHDYTDWLVNVGNVQAPEALDGSIKMSNSEYENIHSSDVLN